MPIDSEALTATLTTTPGVVVSTSAAVELSWQVMSIAADVEHTSSDEEQVAAVRAEYPELVARVDGFWPRRVSGASCW